MIRPVNFENNILTAHENKMMIMPNGDLFGMNGIETRLNNNVIAMGTSGSSKTRSVVIPNLLSCVGSYIVSDPKGNLCRKYRNYLISNGYKIKTINFVDPLESDGYNPFAYLNSPEDYVKLSHYITYAGIDPANERDPFWNRSGEIFLSALIGYFFDSKERPEDITFHKITDLMMSINTGYDDEYVENSGFDRLMEEMNRKYVRANGRQAWSYKQYKKFRSFAPPKTYSTILATIESSIGLLDTPALSKMYCSDTIDFTALGREKTVVFVNVSDTDRTRDVLINTFWSQAMNQLCSYADTKCENSSLKVPVRFILDDFGTNCYIDDFENMISNIRSRNISATIVLQSEAQLMQGYGRSAQTIIDNCDTLVYMGGNDVNTARTISLRSNKPLTEILDMPVGTNWLFRRGATPKHSRTIDLDEYVSLVQPKERSYMTDEEYYMLYGQECEEYELSDEEMYCLDYYDDGQF